VTARGMSPIQRARRLHTQLHILVGEADKRARSYRAEGNDLGADLADCTATGLRQARAEVAKAFPEVGR